jgi:hypothetical protein
MSVTLLKGNKEFLILIFLIQFAVKNNQLGRPVGGVILGISLQSGFNKIIEFTAVQDMPLFHILDNILMKEIGNCFADLSKF